MLRILIIYILNFVVLVEVILGNGVRVTVDKSLKDNAIKIDRIGDRIIDLKIIVDDNIINIISASALLSMNMCSKLKFQNNLEELIQNISLKKEFLLGDI